MTHPDIIGDANASASKVGVGYPSLAAFVETNVKPAPKPCVICETMTRRFDVGGETPIPICGWVCAIVWEGER